MKLLIPGELPTLNEYVGAIARNRYVGGSMKRVHTDIVYYHCREQKLSVCTKPVHITFKWFMKNKKKDIDNVAFAKKFILDGLVKAGVLYNDTQEWVTGFTDEFAIDKENPRVEVLVKEL